ncbi:ParB N-terminal domain-containing protein [Bradyrhizobium sp. BRP56]|uniref:ParB N-terminal domain-containing protein n=1 Tax=Bradyrhizobium sp. BRP56 TaxID=2793819 RepID=UPI001CD3D162|nr:ParB N-terminal domain-containing protein [Bradyrhizobium sp. BRP56]MCA1399838.1 ParB N-terminal domain-containing protein [Bradyrhizobium sp. BRP56]
MPKPESFPIEKIYVPVKRRKAIKPQVVEEIAGSILEIGQQTPILVRPDEDRFVLVEGLQRLEACKALGETTVVGIVVSAEDAQQRTLLSEGPEADAERDKMARLKKLRLEKEAAESSIAALNRTDKERTRSARGAGENPGTSPSRTSAPTSKKTLSEWIAQQKRDGGRY